MNGALLLIPPPPPPPRLGRNGAPRKATREDALIFTGLALSFIALGVVLGWWFERILDGKDGRR